MRTARILALALSAGVVAMASTPSRAQSGAAPMPPGAAVQPQGPDGVGQPGRAPARGRLAERFAAANTTHDGRLTLAQAQAGHMPAIARSFASIDPSGRGYVTLADLQAWRRQQRAAHASAPNAAPQHPARAGQPDSPTP